MANHRWKAGRGTLAAFVSALLLVVSSATAARGSGDRTNFTAADSLSAPQIEPWVPYIEEASARFGIPQDWIRRVMRAESGGRTMLNGRPITSHAGAMGLMQLMPGTWAEMRTKHGLGPDPHDPRDNILAGAAYLRAMYDRVGYPGLFAAYNAGPTRYAEHLASGRRLPAETVAYVRAVVRNPGRSLPDHGNEPRPGSIFIALVSIESRDKGSGASPAPPAAPDALFVRLSPRTAANK